MLWIVFDLDTPISLLLVICLLVLLFAVSVVGCLLGYSSCLVVWIPLFLDPSDGAFGRFDLAALCGCRTLNFVCFFVFIGDATPATALQIKQRLCGTTPTNHNRPDCRHYMWQPQTLARPQARNGLCPKSAKGACPGNDRRTPWERSKSTHCYIDGSIMTMQSSSRQLLKCNQLFAFHGLQSATLDACCLKFVAVTKKTLQCLKAKQSHES